MESGNWVSVRQLTMEEVKRSSQVRINHIEKKKLFSSQDEKACLLRERVKLNITGIKVRFIFTCTSIETFSFSTKSTIHLP